MISYLSSILAPLALQATVVAGLTPTGNGPVSGPTQLAAPLLSGPHKTVASGPHPSYTWPPTEATVTPTCKAVQYQFPSGTNSDPTRANAVKDLYRRSWDQYAKYCFGHDQILTLNNTCADDIFGWGATIVDGIDTAIVMNLTDIVTRQLAFIADVDFTTANSLVDGFDVVIRYLGGLLSSYDLLTSGYVPDGTYNTDHVNALLSQAKTLGDLLKPQFDTPSGLPAANINFTTNTPVNSQFTDPLNNVTYNSSNTAVSGTLVLEFYRLADLTGDDSFRTLADRVQGNLIFPYPAPVYPGLIGSQLDTDTGNYLTYDFGWRAGIDSFIEYLIKTYYYQPSSGATSFMKDFWVTIAESSMENIALHPYDHPELTYLSQGDVAGNLEWQMDDYACFAGGNLLLGGVFLDRQDFYDLGLALTDSCHAFYNTTKTGLGPLAWGWYNASNVAYDPTWNNNATYRESAKEFGYFITPGNEQYDSFPESIESIFYAYRISGDSKWQDYNWEIVQALEKESTSTIPSAPISDVNIPKSFISELPSYYFAEVLKYLFLSFAEPSVISLDDWVFNTECHPMLRNNPGCGS